MYKGVQKGYSEICHRIYGMLGQEVTTLYFLFLIVFRVTPCPPDDILVSARMSCGEIGKLALFNRERNSTKNLV